MTNNTHDISENETPRIIVIGVGNLLMQDEGIGVHTVQALQEIGLPSDVRLIDGGTEPDLIAFTRAGDKMIIIDCAKAGGEPGDIYRFKPEDITTGRGALASAHEMGVAENLNLMSFTGNKPQSVTIIGVEPAVIDWGTELSPQLTKRLPDIVKAVLKEINNA